MFLQDNLEELENSDLLLTIYCLTEGPIYFQNCFLPFESHDYYRTKKFAVPKKTDTKSRIISKTPFHLSRHVSLRTISKLTFIIPTKEARDDYYLITHFSTHCWVLCVCSFKPNFLPLLYNLTTTKNVHSRSPKYKPMVIFRIPTCTRNSFVDRSRLETQKNQIKNKKSTFYKYQAK